MPSNKFQMFKTNDEVKFNDHVKYLIENGLGFTSYTSGDYYIIEYTGGY
jgi:hypothetical protein